MSETDIVIQFEQTEYSYDGDARALDGLSIRIPQRQFLCVLGGNGSGKSTFAKHINALLAPDAGTVRILGTDTSDPDNTYFIRSNAGMVFQNPDDQIISSVIEDDVAFGPENMGLDPVEIRLRVEEALKAVGLQGFERRECAALSGGQKQRVAIAGVLAMKPQILVFDEASAMLDPRGRNGLLKACKALNGQGLTIVYITHFMDEAAQADRVIVLDQGRIAVDGTPDEVLCKAELLESLALETPFAVRLGNRLRSCGMPVSAHLDDEALASEIAELLPANVSDANVQAFEQPHDNGTPRNSVPCIAMEHVSFSYEQESTRKNKGKGKGDPSATAEPAAWGNDPEAHWALADISFELHSGEILGIAGHTGSGKSTLIQLANGLLKPSTGTVSVHGIDISSKQAAAEARRSVGLVFQYPEHQLFAATVYDDVAFGPRNLGLDQAEVDLRVRKALEAVHLDVDQIGQRSPFSLSGGQQRRVAFAGTLAMRPDVLILDEPAAGLDPHARRSLLSLIRELHDTRDLSVIIVSHDMDDLAALCDRLLILNQGRIVQQGTPADVFAHGKELHAIGLGIPHAVAIANEIARRNPGLPHDAQRALFLTEEQLADVLARMYRGAAR